MSLASQGVGVIQLIVVLARVGASGVTDTFFYLFGLAMLPSLIVVVGLVYPMMVNRQRMSRRGLRRVAVIAPTLSCLLVLIGVSWLVVNDRFDRALSGLAVALAINGCLQAFVYFRAVAAEAAGEPLWISGVALPANVLATVFVALPWPSHNLTVTAMAVGLVVGNLLLSAVMVKRRVGVEAIEAAPAEPMRGSAGGSWFLVKSVVSYGSGTFMQSLAVRLPASGVTLLSIGSKIVASVAASFVNAMMPHFIHQGSQSDAEARRFLRIMLAVTSGVGTVVVLVVAGVRPQVVLPVLIMALWLVGSTAAAIVQRTAFRFLPPNASRISMVVVVGVVLAAWLSSLTAGFSLEILLAAYGLVDSLIATFFLLLLKDRGPSYVLLLCSAALVAIWGLQLAGV